MAGLDQEISSNGGIRLVGLRKTYQEGAILRAVLDGVDVEFRQGEFIAIRGPSGSGKTTLLNLLAGIDEPTGGEIYFGEIALSNLTREARTEFRRDNIGFIFQFFNLIPTLTLLENVLLPAELARYDLQEATKRAIELLSRVGLAGRESDPPDILSGGEQQRVALARALLLKPRVILADEPTGNLDRNTGDEVMAILESLRKEVNSLLVMVTHSHTLAKRADRILHLERGLLLEEGQ